MLRVAFAEGCCILAVSTVLIISAASPTSAASIWSGTTNDLWNNDSNWSSDPTNDDVQINGGSHLPVNLDVTDSVKRLWLGTGGGSNGSLTVASGTNLTTTDGICVGVAGTGTVTQTGGDVLDTGYYLIADAAGSAGTYNLSGGSLTIQYAGTVGERAPGAMNVSGSGVFNVGCLGGASPFRIGGVSTNDGFTGTATFTQSGGTVNMNSSLPSLQLGVSTGATGIYNLNGGTLNLATNIVPQAGVSHFNMNGGTMNFTGTSISVNRLNVGNAEGSNGRLAVTDGQTISSGNMTIGGDSNSTDNAHSSHGTVVQPGGIVQTSSNVLMGWAANDVAEYTISGASSVLNVAGYLEARLGDVSFTQNDGTVNVGYLMWLGEGAPGFGDGSATYAMHKGTLNVGGELRVGASNQGLGLLDIMGGTATVADLVFAGSAASKVELGNGMLRVLKANYSEADAWADIAAGHLVGYAGKSLLVSTVDVSGVDYTQIVNSIPEPSTFVLCVLGFIGLLAYAWRKQK